MMSWPHMSRTRHSPHSQSTSLPITFYGQVFQFRQNRQLSVDGICGTIAAGRHVAIATDVQSPASLHSIRTCEP